MYGAPQHRGPYLVLNVAPPDGSCAIDAKNQSLYTLFELTTANGLS